MSKKFKFKLKPTALMLGLGFAVSNSIVSTAFAADVNCSSTLYYCSTQAGDNVTVTTSVNSGLQPLQGYGVYLNSDRYNLNDVTITTSGSASDGIFSNGNNGGFFISKGKINITTTGSSSDGVNLGVRGGPGSSPTNVSKNTAILSGDGGTISAQGIAVRANNNLAEGSKTVIILGNNYVIKQTGTSVDNGTEGNGYAVYAGNRDEDISGFGTMDWLLKGHRNNNKGDSFVFIGENATISSAGKSTSSYKGAAVYANKGGVIQLGNNVSITAPKGAYHLYASTEKQNIGTNNAGQTAEARRGLILLNGDTTANLGGDTNEIIFYAKGAGSTIKSGYIDFSYTDTDVTNDNAIQSSSGKFMIDGGLSAVEGGTIDLNFNNGSKFLGFTTLDAASTISLAINGTTSVWELTKDSQLTNLNLSSNAQVHLGDQATAITPANQVTLTTKNLSGNGHFYVRTDIAGSDDTGLGINISDKIKVTGTSSGNHKIFVSDYSTGSAIGTEIVRVAEIADGVAQFTLSNINGYVDMGAYRYSLNEVDPLTRAPEKHWYLIASKMPSGEKEKTETADHAANILNINYLLNYVETQTLLQRMGELRQSDGAKGDVWARAYAGKLDSFSDGILQGFDMDYTGIQIGADKLFAQDNGNFYLGGMMGTAEAKASYNVGDGKTTSYHAGVYATFKHNNGFYVDGIAKFVRMENTLNTTTGGGYAVKGDGNTSGYSIGVEAGKRFYFKEANAGWYAEPQAQITFAHQDGATIQANNGLRTDLDSFDSTLGRISAIIGYSIVDGASPVDVYFKTGYVKEFDGGDTGYTYNNAIHEGYKFNGGWWDNGIGINAQVNKVHNLYLDANYSTGSKFDQMQINAGYRYAF